jgi:hypothetical protein
MFFCGDSDHEGLLTEIALIVLQICIPIKARIHHFSTEEVSISEDLGN